MPFICPLTSFSILVYVVFVMTLNARQIEDKCVLLLFIPNCVEIIHQVGVQFLRFIAEKKAYPIFYGARENVIVGVYLLPYDIVAVSAYLSVQCGCLIIPSVFQQSLVGGVTTVFPYQVVRSHQMVEVLHPSIVAFWIHTERAGDERVKQVIHGTEQEPVTVHRVVVVRPSQLPFYRFPLYLMKGQEILDEPHVSVNASPDDRIEFGTHVGVTTIIAVVLSASKREEKATYAVFFYVIIPIVRIETEHWHRHLVPWSHFPPSLSVDEHVTVIAH